LTEFRRYYGPFNDFVIGQSTFCGFSVRFLARLFFLAEGGLAVPGQWRDHGNYKTGGAA
jgi:hypothetical protein